MLATAARISTQRAEVNPEFARDVENGLTQKRKSLPPVWFYDAVGSALFEVITLLPEYGLSRSDAVLLERSAAEIITTAGYPQLVIELGSGTGSKTRHVLSAAAVHTPIRYFPIDVSGAALENCVRMLSGISGVTTHPVEATYLDGISRAMQNRRPGERALVLFLGSTIGNFSRQESAAFFRDLATRLKPGDTLLLGADLVKPREVLLRAYDDPTGVTAAFNLNLLARINRELGGEFDLACFAHEARWNQRQSRIEMHLRSRCAQAVRIRELDLTITFAPRETIWTESSRKFHCDEIARIGSHAGWRSIGQWLDHDWGFAETLLAPRATT